MDNIIKNGFIFVQATENDAFDALIADFIEEGLTYFLIESENTFNDLDKKESICHMIFIWYSLEHTYVDVEQILQKHSKTVTSYSECDIVIKYVIAYAETIYDANMQCSMTYSEEDIIGKYNTYEEAEKAFEIVRRVYEGTEPIEFMDEYYYYDSYGKPFLICRMPIESCYVTPEETYVIALSEKEYKSACTLDKILFEYYSFEEAKEVFESLKLVFADLTHIPVLVKRNHKFARTGENKIVKEEVIDSIEK